MTAGGGRWGSGVEGLSKKEKRELMDTDNSVVIVGRGCWVEVKDGIGGINDNGKNTIKI